MKTIKHLFTLLLLLCATEATAHGFEVDGISYNVLSYEDNTVEVTSKIVTEGTITRYYFYTGSVVIPESVTIDGVTYRVTNIGGSAFNGCHGLTGIEIPKSVASIGDYAFCGCTGLTSIEIPNSVTSIGDCAFSECSGLTSIKIPNCVTSIGYYALAGCSNLTSIEIHGSVASIGDYVFNRCTGLTSIVVAEENPVYDSRNNCNAIIETASNTLLSGCKNTIIPDGVTNIGNFAFLDCTGLTSIEIPNCVTSIGDCAFANCTNLSSVVIGNGVTSIKNSAFLDCTGLTSIEIPNSVTSIGDYAFAYCTNLSSVVVGNGVTSIGHEAFLNTYWFDNLPDGVTYIGNVLYIYKGTMETSIVIKDGTSSIAEYAFNGCTSLTSIDIPNSVTSIGSYAFAGCFSLMSIEIPCSVTNIGEKAFYNCSGLTSIVVAEENSVYDSRNNCNAIIETATNTLLNGCKNTIIPDGVTSIGANAFYGCYYLTNIEIPNSVTRIKHSAFEGCSRLTSIEIPNSVTSIGEYAFCSCSSLINVEIPSSVTSIGSYTFSECSGLTSVKIPNSVTSIGNSAFYRCTVLASIEIPSSVTSIGGDAFKYCFALTNVVIGNSVTSIGDMAFYRCLSLTSIEIPNSVTSIGRHAFDDCTDLTSVVIGNSVTSIGIYAFSNSSLTGITSLIPADALFAVNSSTFNDVDKNACTLYVPYGAKETYSSTKGWSEFANIVELEPIATEASVTIGQYGSATFCSDYALDFSNVEGLKAYAATGYNIDTQVITMTRVQTAVAGTGLFLKGAPGEYVVPVIERSGDRSMNMLAGALKQTTVNSTSSDGVYTNYYYTIKDGESTPNFYLCSDNSIIGAGEAYLQIPTVWLPVAASKTLDIRFDEGEFTDIDDVLNEVKGENIKLKGVCYDMQGRVVENPTSGIYIINGKKVLVK